MKIFFEFFYNNLDKYVHRPKIKRYLKKLKIDCKNIIDVGSHKGESIDFFYEMFNKSKIFGFEPQKDCYKYLEKKYKFTKNIKVINHALGEKREIKKIYKNHLSTTATFSKVNLNSKHHFIKSFLLGKKNSGYYNYEKVKINNLKYYLKKFSINNIDLIKIDTEGHELEVLQGFKNNFKLIKIIIIEQNSTDYYKNYNLKKIKNILKKNFFINVKNIKFPFMNFTDSFYINSKKIRLKDLNEKI